jgi:hypothetical protein
MYSNGYIERFHQEYDRNVWAKIILANLTAVQTHSTRFFDEYRQSQHHSALQGNSPAELHLCGAFPKLPLDFQLPDKLPLTAGRVHFLRLVNDARQISILNANWNVPKAQPAQGIWATLEFLPRGAKLSVFDYAPDARKRTCLAVYPFPLHEPVVPLQAQFSRLFASQHRNRRQGNASTTSNAQVRATMS